MKVVILLMMSAYFLFASTVWAQKGGSKQPDVRQIESRILAVFGKSQHSAPLPCSILHPQFDLKAEACHRANNPILLEKLPQILLGLEKSVTEGTPAGSNAHVAVKLISEISSALDVRMSGAQQLICTETACPVFSDDLIDAICGHYRAADSGK